MTTHIINIRTLVTLFVLLAVSCRYENGRKHALRELVSDLYNPSLKPFYHGVASGDPLHDRVVLWTRVTPDDSATVVPLSWELASDSLFASVIQKDSGRAEAVHDYTFKVDVGQLKPGTSYYYRFHALGGTSITGRTRTASDGATDSVKFAVATCANWEWGHFNAYAAMARHTDLDAVVHLGDYIYEHATGVYGDTTIGRIYRPKHELLTLSDYRIRYSEFRLDEGLRRVHQLHPFIVIWDDHEIANNSYMEGAENHQPSEGDYNLRKAAARQAYYEWLPLREEPNLYRAFSFGSLADLIMLDERLAGRTKPVGSTTDPQYNDPARTMLGSQQLAWLDGQLGRATAQWKIIGNQVLFSDMDLSPVRRQSKDLDSWDGYPAEKERVKELITGRKLKNVIFITGDTHSSWAIEAATGIKGTRYDPFAVELCTTSISSGNGDEGHPVDSVKMSEANLLKVNPHVKFYNNRDHGYLLLSLYRDRARAQWYFVKTLRRPDSSEFLAKDFIIENGSVKLTQMVR